MVFNLLPAIPPQSLRDLVFLLLVIPLILRLSMMSGPILRGRAIFAGRTKEAVSLLQQLEIPGVKTFFAREAIMLFVPYVFAATFFLTIDLSKKTLSEMNQTAVILTIVGLAIWMVLDIHRSREANRFLHSLIDQIVKFESRLTEYGHDIIWGLKILVTFRQGLKKTATKLARRAARLLVRDATQDGDAAALPGAEVVGRIFGAIETLVSAPFTLTQAVLEGLLGHIDDKIESHFLGYTKRPWYEIMTSLIWGLIPPIWLLFILYLMPTLTG